MDPILSLSMTLHSNKGCYAVLLGSGASRSAGIPTGWEIVLDLIRRLAVIKSETCEPNPEKWYAKEFQREPDYSEILNCVAQTSTERLQLLRTYFEPTEEERDSGKKLPTPAHRAIAKLVKSGCIRVIVTTNFDRLMESALSECGVHFEVIATPDAAEGALPLVHSKCTIIKVHGDYLDSRFKNTVDELSEFDPRINRLLDQVFDEFGLLVCGWSAEWDHALRSAIERCKGRRFSTYWIARDAIGASAQSLIGLRAATLIQTAGADKFFNQISEKVQSLEDFSYSHPVSAKVAVATLKRYLTNDESRIRLADLIREETESAFACLMSPAFLGRKLPNEISLERKFEIYDSQMEIVIGLISHGCRWGESKHIDLWKGMLERFGTAERVREGTLFVATPDLRIYPALLLLYSGGIASVLAKRYDVLFALLYGAHAVGPNETHFTVSLTALDSGVAETVASRFPRVGRIALSRYLHAVLRDTFRDIEPDDHAYDISFDRFECLLCLALGDMMVGRSLTPRKGAAQQIQPTSLDCPMPVGRIGISRSQYTDAISLLIAEQQAAEMNWLPFKAGMFGGDLQRFQSLASSLHAKRNQCWTP